MSGVSTTLAGRIAAESLMTTEGVVGRRNGTFTTDPVTLVETENFDTIYTGVCKYRFGASQPSDAPIPGAVGAEQNATLSFPVATSGAITVGDVWTCTANPLDLSLVGKTLRISGMHSQSYATARRFPVVEAT